MIKKIKLYYKKFIEDLNCVYLPLKKVLLNYFIIIVITLFFGVLIGRLMCPLSNDNTSNTNITLASQDNIELVYNNYYLLPTLPYVEDGNVYYSNDCLIFYSPVDNVTSESYFGLIYSQRQNDNTVLVDLQFNSGVYINNQNILINYGDYSYARKYYNKSFQIILYVYDYSFAEKVDSIYTYSYLIHSGEYDADGVFEYVKYNTVYDFKDVNDNKLLSLYFLPDHYYLHNSNGIFNTLSHYESNIVTSLDVTELYDIGFDSGSAYWTEVGYSKGYIDGKDDGYKEGVKDGEESQLTFWTVITNGINSFLNINILPNVSIGTICLIPIALLMFNLLIKLFKV